MVAVRLRVYSSAFAAGKTAAKWIELGNQSPAANLATLATSSAFTVAEEILTMIRASNDDKLQNEQRCGI